MGSLVDRWVFSFYKIEEMSVALSHGTMTGKLNIFLAFYSVISEVRIYTKGLKIM